MLNLHPLECTIKDNDHIPDLLLIKYWGIISCKYFSCQIVIPKSGLAPQSSANLLRQVRPFYQKNADGADVFLFNYKGQAVGVFLSYTEGYVNIRMSSFGPADSRLMEMK